MQIYLARNQVQAGPYTLDQLNKMLATQQVDLNDLMWHEGMTQWHRVGELTNGTHHYNPNSGSNASTPSHRVTVDELNGKKSAGTAHNPHTNKSGFRVSQAVNLTKHQPISVGKNELASVIKRVAAVLIDQILALLCLVPLLSAMSLNLDTLEAATQDPSVLIKLMDAVPAHLTSMTGLMFLALMIVQIFMLIRRGQSLGKLIMGVRILDINTQKLPSVTNIILLRTIVKNLAYNLPYIGQFILIADFITMLVDKKKRSLHDKLAKTFVVKADNSQL